MDKQAIIKEIAKLKKENQKQRFDLSLNKLSDTSKLKETRKKIARLYTEYNDPKKKDNQ